MAAWLYRIATNTAYDYLRRRRRIRFTPLMDVDAPPSGAHSMESRLDEEEPVQRALAQIPTMYRLPLVLHSCEGRSTQEIAEAMGVLQQRDQDAPVPRPRALPRGLSGLLHT